MADNGSISSNSSIMSSAGSSEGGYIHRRRYTEQELRVLMRSFRRNPRPSRAVKERLAEQLEREKNDREDLMNNQDLDEPNILVTYEDAYGDYNG
ncbi:hypothetical protein K492DRAFT_193862 [Lichtheimia hyalospora FSU 10163]|nr:hypothetical protein K492DRAFT_193862 [Lichtheimia hyalospora FSU 10163]